MKKQVYLLWFVILTISSQAQGSLDLPLQSPDSVREELIALFKELRIKHPGFYRYCSPSEFDKRIDSTLQTLDAPLTELEILRKVKPLIAQIGCLHTGIHLSDETEMKLNSFPNCLPLGLYVDRGKVYIWKTFDPDTPAKIGEQIVRLNGKEIGEIYQKLLASIPMDGYNQTGKYKLLQYMFPQWYRNMIEVTDTFLIETATGQRYTLPGITAPQLTSYRDIVDQPLSLSIEDSLARIQIPSFANSYHKEHKQTFKKELRAYFDRLEEKDIQTLVLDLRSNTGGSDSNPAWLASYFFDSTFSYWDPIEVTESIAQEVKGMARLFYGKPTYSEGKWLWSDKGLSAKEFRFTRVQQPQTSPFEGKVFLLTDGLCLSSCADFAAIMKHNEKAILIGEETGGGYVGNTSGLIPSEELACGLVVDVPLLKYQNAVDPQPIKGRGALPDIEAVPTLGEILDEDVYWDRIKNSIGEK